MPHRKAPTGEKARQILLIEDDPGVRRSLQLLLHGQGFNVQSFATPRQALAEPASLKTTHLVVDYALPEEDGIVVLGSLKKYGWDGRSVLITAYYSDELQRRAEVAGFDVVLAKPFRDSTLLDALAAR